MKLQSGLKKRYRKCFILDEDGLRRIEGVLREAQSKLDTESKIVFRIERTDDRFYETESIDEVLTDPNVKDRKVSLLNISLRIQSDHTNSDSDFKSIVAIEFEDDNSPYFFRCDIFFKIVSEDKTWALLLADELEPQVSRVIKATQTPRWILYLYTIPLGVLALKLSRLFDLSTSLLLLVFFCLISTYLLSKMLSFTSNPKWFTKYFGPESVFLWGDEVEEYLTRSKTRQNLFWVVIVGFLVSFAASGWWIIIGGSEQSNQAPSQQSSSPDIQDKKKTEKVSAPDST